MGFLFSLIGSGAGLTQQATTPKVSPASTLSRPAMGDSVTSPKAGTRFLITGTVVNSLSKSPVAKAEVKVSPMGARQANRRPGQTHGQNGSQPTVLTDTAGHFELEVPSAGGWSVTAVARGYHTGAYDEHEGYSTAIILTENSPTHAIYFPLTPAGAIEGFVLDEAGEPVRNANLRLTLIPPAMPEDQHPRRQGRGNQGTDDRGYYKFSGLLAGVYEIRVQAQPWYADSGGMTNHNVVRLSADGVNANSARAGSPSATSTDGATGPDPLDVVYPTEWYPGVTDFAEATPIVLRGGETRQADLRLGPVPGFHLRIPAEPTATGEQPGFRGLPGNSYLSQILPDGSETRMPIALRIDPQGDMEYSGLAPGTYVLHRQGDGAGGGSAAETVRIAANSARTIDLSQVIPATPVTVRIDAEADRPSLQVTFRDMETGRTSSAQVVQTAGPGRGRRISLPGEAATPEVASGKSNPSATERVASLQPGRYEVVVNGIDSLHLSRIEAAGATATGRIVTIGGGGAPVLTLHVASGRGNVTGTVQFHGEPDEGAMVLLVPATLGDPAGLDVTRRDQSNTDGSFDITNVLPGAYILVAIDHGWDVNWSDPATLRSYLTHGLPLDLTRGGDRVETVAAQSP